MRPARLGSRAPAGAGLTHDCHCPDHRRLRGLGGAGAQTDLKTFHTLGVYGCTALTCIVSMDPKDGWNHRFVPVDPGVIADQIETCAAVHSRIDAVKIGMLGTAPHHRRR